MSDLRKLREKYFERTKIPGTSMTWMREDAESIVALIDRCEAAEERQGICTKCGYMMHTTVLEADRDEWKRRAEEAERQTFLVGEELKRAQADYRVAANTARENEQERDKARAALAKAEAGRDAALVIRAEILEGARALMAEEAARKVDTLGSITGGIVAANIRSLATLPPSLEAVERTAMEEVRVAGSEVLRHEHYESNDSLRRKRDRLRAALAALEKP